MMQKVCAGPYPMRSAIEMCGRELSSGPTSGLRRRFAELVGKGLTGELDPKLGRYWHAYAEVMAHWREVLPAGVMLDVHYEAVVENVEREARRIIAHCGLEWDDRCLDFPRAQRPVRTASVVQVRQPIYSSSVGRWRPDDVALRPLLEALRGAPWPVGGGINQTASWPSMSSQCLGRARGEGDVEPVQDSFRDQK